MPIPTQQDIDAARGDIEGRKYSIREERYLFELADAELTEANRSGDEQLVEAKLLLKQQRQDALAARLAQQEQAVEHLRALVAARVLALTPEQELEGLEGANPIVLFPVRLETRFDLTNQKLKIRIFPDAVVADSFEFGANDFEESLRQQYLDAGATEEAWRDILLRNVSPERAAWLVEQRAGEPPPSVYRRKSDWTIPVTTKLMPDRWVAVAYPPDGPAVRGLSAAVREPLSMSLDPQADLNNLNDNAKLSFDSEAEWMVDFQQAMAAGMAVEIPYTGTGGFDRLIVFGVKASLPPDRNPLSELFGAHKFTRGVSLVPQGTATNNVRERSAGYPVADLDGKRSYHLLSAPLNVEGADGYVAAEFLGIDPDFFRSIDGGDGFEQEAATAMNVALWPATWDYFFRHMMAPTRHGAFGQPRVFNDATIEELRTFFVIFVKGRGPCPAVRLDGTPYGILPVSSLARWKGGTSSNSVVDTVLPEKLALLRNAWLQAAGGVQRVGSNPSDPESDLMAILAQAPSSREFRVRPFLGEAVAYNVFGVVLRAPFAAISDWTKKKAKESFGIVDESELDVRLNGVFAVAGAAKIAIPLIKERPTDATPSTKQVLAEDRDLSGHEIPESPRDWSTNAARPSNYIDRLLGASIVELRDLDVKGEGPNVFLFHLLRHSLLLEYVRIARKRRAEISPIPGQIEALAESGVVEVLGIEFDVPTIWSVIEGNDPGDPARPFADYILENAAPFRDSLRSLSGLPQKELERLLTETLDLATYRLDAWITGLAARRLQDYLRSGDGLVLDQYVGGYGWVEDLRPNGSVQTNTLGDGRVVELQGSNDGFIHAPSLEHAKAGAILRSGFTSYSDEAAARFAVDLSSKRVRQARELGEAVRNGQPLGAVLGYRFERGLQDSGLQKFLGPLRARYPLVANKDGSNDAPTEAVAARNVLDGLPLHDAWKAAGDAIFESQFPTATATEKQTLRVAFRELVGAIDAYADLQLAEAAFQFARGNIAGAAAATKAMASAGRPNDPEFSRTPQGGTPVTHRAIFVFNEVPNEFVGPWGGVTTGAGATPRASANLMLDVWLGKLIGAPTTIFAWTKHSPAGASAPVVSRIDAVALGLRPMDWLELARERGQSRNVLDRRVLKAAFGTGPVPVNATVTYDAPEGESFDPGTQKTFADALEILSHASSSISQGRALRSSDLIAMDGTGSATEDAFRQFEFLAAQEVAARLLQVKVDLQNALLNVDIAAVGAAMTAAAQFVSEGFPDPRWDAAKLREEANLLVRVVNQRNEEAQKHVADPLSSLEKKALGIRNAVFGRNTPFFPRIRLSVAEASEVSKSLVALQTTGPGLFLRQVARVRPAVSAWRQLWLFAQSGGAPKVNAQVAQLPHVPGEAWAGGEVRPEGGRLSVILERFEGEQLPTFSSVAAGLVVDEWTELIPHEEAQTGVAFNYTKPNSEAPQTILVAVPPDFDGWKYDDLVATINETLDLAKIRAVHSELLGSSGHALPASYLSTNHENDEVSTDFEGLVVGEPSIGI